MPWVEANCEFSRQLSNAYMKAYKNYQISNALEITTLRALLGYDSDTLATKHTGDEESYTPDKYIEAAREIMGG